MWIEKIELENIKCFEHEMFEFSPGFNVIIGDNGTGKTTLIEACTAVLSAMVINNISLGSLDIQYLIRKSMLSGQNSIPILENADQYSIKSEIHTLAHDIYYSVIAGDSKIPSTMSKKFTVSVEMSKKTKLIDINDESMYDFIDRLFQIRDFINRNDYITGFIGFNNIELYFEKTKKYPIVSKYSTNRNMESYISPLVDVLSSIERTSVYQNWSNISENIKQNHLWLKTLEMSVLQRKTENPILNSVKSAIKSCMADDQPGEVYYDILLSQLCFNDKNGEAKPLDFLSDGQQSMMSMVMDLAIRAAILNPHLENPPAETPGIVLIDELDLHLHPKWQRRIVSDLRRTFPKMQFIATTHSPLIIQSLRPGELIDLNDPDTKPDYEYSGRTPEDILEDGMGVEMPERSHKWKEMYKTAEEYYALLDQGENLNGKDASKKAELRQRLDVLMVRYEEDPAFAAYTSFLKQKRLASGIDTP
jgi:predicted ATP-binding protein involved in virulence